MQNSDLAQFRGIRTGAAYWRKSPPVQAGHVTKYVTNSPMRSTPVTNGKGSMTISQNGPSITGT